MYDLAEIQWKDFVIINLIERGKDPGKVDLKRRAAKDRLTLRNPPSVIFQRWEQITPMPSV